MNIKKRKDELCSYIAIAAIVICGGNLFTSCADKDVFNVNYRTDEYAANWQNKFGDIDPKQDWNLATVVTATANIKCGGNCVMTVFTDNPVYSTAKQLARTVLSNGTGTVAFDVAKGMEQVFVSIQKNGKSLVYGYSDIVDGKVDAATVTARHTAVTRIHCLTLTAV